ncbi:MAG: hypothetical protein ABL994_22110, partial [Verrucomicrobiales bacterium]
MPQPGAIEADHELVQGQVRVTVLESGVATQWDFRASTHSIIWFFASTSDVGSKLIFLNQDGRSGNPVWIRSTPGAGNSSVTLTATSSGGPVKTRIWAEAETEFDPAEPNDGFEIASELTSSGE